MPAITGQELVSDAFALLNVFLPGESPDAASAQFARRLLNDLLGEWSQRALMIPIIARERFTLTASQGGPTNPYTIGPSGDFDTERPSNQNSIVGANLILTASTPEVRKPLGVFTDDAYAATKVPDLTSTQPTALYYNPTYAGDLGSIYLWPVPNNAVNDLELFLQKSIPAFANLTTTYYVPESAPAALKYNLADRLQGPFGRQLAASDQRLAVSTLGTFKRSNVKLDDLATDAFWAATSRTLYNVQTGSGG